LSILQSSLRQTNFPRGRLPALAWTRLMPRTTALCVIVQTFERTSHYIFSRFQMIFGGIIQSRLQSNNMIDYFRSSFSTSSFWVLDIPKVGCFV
jgi:hypothetical protein